MKIFEKHENISNIWEYLRNMKIFQTVLHSTCLVSSKCKIAFLRPWNFLPSGSFTMTFLAASTSLYCQPGGTEGSEVQEPGSTFSAFTATVGVISAISSFVSSPDGFSFSLGKSGSIVISSIRFLSWQMTSSSLIKYSEDILSVLCLIGNWLIFSIATLC